MLAYENVISKADDNYQQGRFKEASIEYGKALTVGGGRDSYCRQMRGLCSRLVAEQRLKRAEEEPALRQKFIEQAARWLSKAEAYLDSSLEDAAQEQRGRIRLEQARLEETVARFLVMCGADPERRLAAARDYREEGLALLH